MKLRRVCVFCGSRVGARADYRDAAEQLAAELVRREIGLVFGGGKVGLMGIVADAVMEAGGEAIGVIPHGLMVREVGHGSVSELIVVDSMHERKAKMAELSDAFIALPGGLGTLEETFEVITWHQLGIHRKPCGLLDVAGYWSPLLELLDHSVAEGFVDEPNRALLVDADRAGRLLDALERYESPIASSWLTRSDS